jgi:hypothetical protein
VRAQALAMGATPLTTREMAQRQARRRAAFRAGRLPVS